MSKQLNCPYCSATSSHGAGLASHIRSAHADKHDAWSAARKGGAKVTVTPSAAPAGISGGLSSIIASLEQQRSAIESALAALRAVGGSVSAEPAKRKRGRPRKVA
jgi:hypothetical protein